MKNMTTNTEGKHNHEWKTGRSKNVETCFCGRFRNIINEENPAIVAKEGKHTPGPWQWNEFYSLIDAPAAYGKSKGYVTDLSVKIKPEDARLIAAAPELLRATISAYRRLQDRQRHGGLTVAEVTTLAMLGGSIAKAEGR